MTLKRSQFVWEKQQNRHCIKSLSNDFYDGDVDKLIKFLTQLKLDYDGVFDKLEIETYNYYDDTSIELYGWRYETDEEFDKRIKDQEDRLDGYRKRAADLAKKKKDADYKKYLELKIKFKDVD